MKTKKINNTVTIVYVPISTMQYVRELAHYILQKKLVACINIIPGVQSIYFWKGKIAEDNELIILIKIFDLHYQKLQEAIREKHPYQVPCIVKIDSEVNKDFSDVLHHVIIN